MISINTLFYLSVLLLVKSQVCPCTTKTTMVMSKNMEAWKIVKQQNSKDHNFINIYSKRLIFVALNQKFYVDSKNV